MEIKELWSGGGCPELKRRTRVLKTAIGRGVQICPACGGREFLELNGQQECKRCRQGLTAARNEEGESER